MDGYGFDLKPGAIKSSLPPLSAGCTACCRTDRNLLKVDMLSSEKDVTKVARGDRNGGDECALSCGNEWGNADIGDGRLPCSKSSSWEGMRWRSSLPCLLGGKRGVVAVLSRRTMSSGSCPRDLVLVECCSPPPFLGKLL